MGERRGMKALELWSRKIVGGYRDVQLDNMASSWRDGLAFCAIIHHFRPDLVDFDSLSKENIFYNNNLAFTVAEQHLGIPALLDAEDMVTYKVPDKLSIMTYLSQLYKYFHGMEESPKKSPSKRSLEDKESITALAEPPGKLPTPSPIVALSSSSSSSPRVQRRSDSCHACKNRIYILERLIVDNKLYHRTCFKCHKCRAVLHPGSYVESKDSFETYKCIQCPSDEDRCDRSRLATTVALSRFLENVEQPSSRPETFAKSARGSVISKPIVNTPLPVETAASSPLTITDAVAKARNDFCSDVCTNAVVVEDWPTPFDDTGQCETSPPPLPTSPAPSDNSASVADIRNNNVAAHTLDEENVFRGVKAITTDHVPCPITEVPCQKLDGDSEIANEDQVCIRKNRRISNNQATQQAETGGVEPSELGVSSGSVERKSVSEMIKMFAANKERGEMQRVAVVRPQMPVDVRTSHSVPAESRQEDECMQLKPEDKDEKSKQEQLIVPRAAPRAHRKKSEELDTPSSLEENKSVEIAVPVAKRRTLICPRVQVDCEIVDGEESAELPPPPKPPRSISTLHDDEEEAKAKLPINSPDYPDHLNPFGEEEDEVSESKSLNPFGSSEDGSEPETDNNAAKNVGSNLNPFSSDSDSDAEKDDAKSTPPVPASRPSVTRSAAPPNPSPRHSIDNSSGTKTMTMGRKKRLAPLPPGVPYSPTGSGSAASSPRVTPIPSPRTPRRTSAPPRPPPPPPPPSSGASHCVSRGEDGKSFRPIPVDFDVSSLAIAVGSPHDDVSGNNSNMHDVSDLSDTKSLKELDNMNITKATNLFSSSPVDKSLTPSTDSSNRTSTNFGYWKRKKPAPAVPVPRRRQIRKLPLAEIQAELIQIEENQLELEKQGVEIEMTIREKFSDDVEPSIEEECLIMNLFELVNKKNALFRRQAELIYLKRQQRLEEEHADLEFQIRCLLEKPAHKKTDEDRELEDKLIARLVDVVHQRSEIIESMEMDRLREAEEDQSIQERMHLQRNQLQTGSMSSQGSFGSIHSGASSSLNKAEKSKADKKKDKKKKKAKKKGIDSASQQEINDEDKDLDESESANSAKTKDKKKKWFL